MYSNSAVDLVSSYLPSGQGFVCLNVTNQEAKAVTIWQEI